MKIIEFLQKFEQPPAFSIKEVEGWRPGFERENLLNWQKKGHIIRIRNGWYSVKGRIATEEHLYWVANKIYWPSYVSLETAFYHYGWIPEAVFTVTSVSTRKTQVFDTAVGRFRYASVKPSLFFGYRLLRQADYRAKIAEPEKALLDYLYLHPSFATTADFEAIRFNIEQLKTDIDWEKMTDYCSLFDSATLTKRVNALKIYLNHAETA